MNPRPSTFALGSLALALGLAAASGPRSPAAPNPPSNAPHKFVGVAQCIGCHSFENAARNPGAKLYIDAGSNQFVRLDENITWVSHDLHSQAYQNLDPERNRLARQMQENLAKVRPAGYSIQADADCLACHASCKDKSVPPGQRTAAAFDTIQGVSCEMCHGFASNWREKHVDLRRVGGRPVNEWRLWTAAEKAAWGLTDLRDPAVRAETCAACHVGSKAEGRFVTHEMFAAGHPPLPPFDGPTFARDEPRHWGLPRQLRIIADLAESKPADAWASFHYRSEKGPEEEVYAARRLAESTVAAFRASVRHIGQLAAASTGGLDFAAFDCYACHHDLKYPSERQKRGFAGLPGRPSFRPSQTALVRIVVKNASGESLAELDAIEVEMSQAFALQAFGDLGKVRAAAEKLDAWGAAALKSIQGVRYTRGKSLELLRDLAAAGRDEAGRVADPETAQMIAGAFLTLRNEFQETGTKEPEGMASACSALESLVVTRVRPDPLGVKKVKNDDVPTPVADRIAARMKLFNAFEPPKFRAAFQNLSPLVDGLK